MSDAAPPRARWRFEPNPILVKEVRSQLRNGRVFVMLTGLLLLLGAAGYGLFLRVTSFQGQGVMIMSAQIGQTLFGGLALALLLGVCIIAPAVTVGAISSERERLTYEMLVATQLSPARILLGKLIASLSSVALLLIAAIPLGSIVFLFGGLTFKLVVQTLTVIVMTAVTCAMLGVTASALFGRTARAAIATYLLIGLVMVGLLFSAQIWQARNSDQLTPVALLAPNPLSAVASVLAPLGGGPIMGNMFMGNGPMPPDLMIKAAPFFAGGGSGIGLGGSMSMGSGLSMIPGWNAVSTGLYRVNPNSGQTEVARSVWRTTLVLEIMACLGLFWLSLHLVRPRRRWRIGLSDLGMLASSGLVLAVLGLWRGWWLS